MNNAKYPTKQWDPLAVRAFGLSEFTKNKLLVVTKSEEMKAKNKPK